MPCWHWPYLQFYFLFWWIYPVREDSSVRQVGRAIPLGLTIAMQVRGRKVRAMVLLETVVAVFIFSIVISLCMKWLVLLLVEAGHEGQWRAAILRQQLVAEVVRHVVQGAKDWDTVERTFNFKKDKKGDCVMSFIHRKSGAQEYVKRVCGLSWWQCEGLERCKVVNAMSSTSAQKLKFRIQLQGSSVLTMRLNEMWFHALYRSSNKNG